MSVHRIEPSPANTVNVFSAAHQPAVTIESGDTIVVRSLDAAGYLERHEFPGDTGKPVMFPGDFRGHAVNRPAAVRGAVPGDMLAVRVVSLTPEPWGWTVLPAVPDSPVARRLGLAGDGHAAQGDGESCGTAIECGMTTEATVSIAAGLLLATIHAQTPAGLVTFGFSADLNEAMGDALEAMVSWIASLYGTSRAEALALASTCADLRVTQVVNVTWGVHALLPAGLISESPAHLG